MLDENVEELLGNLNTPGSAASLQEQLEREIKTLETNGLIEQNFKMELIAGLKKLIEKLSDPAQKFSREELSDHLKTLEQAHTLNTYTGYKWIQDWTAKGNIAQYDVTQFFSRVLSKPELAKQYVAQPWFLEVARQDLGSAASILGLAGQYTHAFKCLSEKVWFQQLLREGLLGESLEGTKTRALLDGIKYILAGATEGAPFILSDKMQNGEITPIAKYLAEQSWFYEMVSKQNQLYQLKNIGDFLSLAGELPDLTKQIVSQTWFQTLFRQELSETRDFLAYAKTNREAANLVVTQPWFEKWAEKNPDHARAPISFINAYLQRGKKLLDSDHPWQELVSIGGEELREFLVKIDQRKV